MVGFPVQQQQAKKKPVLAPVSSPVSPAVTPAAAGGAPKAGAPDGKAVLANQGRLVQQTPVNYAGRIAGQMGKSMQPVGGGRMPPPIQPRPAPRPMPAETQNRAFRAQNAGSGNFMRTPRAPSPTPTAAPGLRPKEYVGTMHSKDEWSNPLTGFTPNTLGSGPATTPFANVGAAIGAIPYTPPADGNMQVLNPSSGAAAVGAPTEYNPQGNGMVPQGEILYGITGSGGNTATGGGAVDPTSGNTGGQPGPNTYEGSDPNAAYTQQGRESSGNPVDDLLSTLGDIGGDWSGNKGVGGVPTGPFNPGNMPPGPPNSSDFASWLAGLMSDPAAAAAKRINESNRPVLDDWFGDYGLGSNKEYAKSLLDPNVQAEAEKAGREQLRSDVDYNTDRNLRMQMSQAAGGGRMGGGSTQAAYDSANKATADGQRQLIKDAFQRKLQAGQLGTQINSDAARQINAILNDQYTSPNDIMAIMAQLFPEAFGAAAELAPTPPKFF